MEGGSSLETESKDAMDKRETPESVLDSKIEPFVPRKGYDPRDLRSWAKKTGFVTFSGETERGISGMNIYSNSSGANDGFRIRVDLEKNESISPTTEIDPILRRTRKRGHEIEPASGDGGGNGGRDRKETLGFRDGAVKNEAEASGNEIREMNLGAVNGSRIDKNGGNENGFTGKNGPGSGTNAEGMEQKIGDGDLGEVDGDAYRLGDDSIDGGLHPSPKMVCGMKDSLGYAWI